MIGPTLITKLKASFYIKDQKKVRNKVSYSFVTSLFKFYTRIPCTRNALHQDIDNSILWIGYINLKYIAV